MKSLTQTNALRLPLAKPRPQAETTAPHLLYVVAVSAYMNNDNRALSLFLKNPEASLAEKALIRARKEMKVGRYNEARVILDGFTTESNLLRGDQHFLRASLHSHASEWELALQEISQANANYLLCHNDRGLFLSHYNSSVYFNRLGLDQLSLHHLNQSSMYAHTPAHQSLLHRAKACHFSRLNQFPTMLGEINRALQLRDQLDDTERATLDTVAAELFFRGGEHEKALATLSQLANSKVIRDKARTRFDLTLLAALIEKRAKLVEGEPSPAIAENQEYLVRWQIIANLQNGDLSQARTKWEALRSQFPTRFAADFTAKSETDERSIFMAAIRRLMQNQTAPDAVPKLTGKLGKLFEALAHAPIALRKEELIEKVWSTHYDPAFDARFYKLIERLRRETQIEMVNQTYRLK